MYTRICLITVVIIGLTDARADDLSLYDSLRREAESYAVYCTTNCQQEMKSFLKDTNKMSTCSFSLKVTKEIASTYGNLAVSNVVFCIEREKDSARLYKVVLYYENGYRFEANYADGLVFNLIRQTGERKFRTYHLMIEEDDPDKIMCVDTEVVTQGRSFDLKYGPIRYYRNRKLEREDPPAKLSSLLGK